ncbi:MAG: hypothetical protein AAB775_01120 [Patescibacteria group bacterium]
MTNIPKGHDEIITAWNRRRRDMLWGTEDLGVPAYLHAQKLVAMEKSNDTLGTGEKRSVNLDELQQETKKLLALLKDRQPGLMTWNEFLWQRLQNLHKLTSQALGK